MAHRPKTREQHRIELDDPRWKRLRFFILLRDDCKCVNCGNDQEVCDVHHKGYIDGKALWQYPGKMLSTLCRTCHKEAHNHSFLLFDDAHSCSKTWERRKAEIRAHRARLLINSLAQQVA